MHGERMKTSIKILLLKAITFTMVFATMIFCVGSSIVIFTRAAEIILQTPYTKAEASAIMVGIGVALIWLIVLISESADWSVRAALRRISKIR
tara:strand:- start:1011 stop:1289 length:279 start_codon:yes stop_codon:yes gene_type:complete